MTRSLGGCTVHAIVEIEPQGSKDPNNRALGPKYYNINGIWALKPYYLGPWTLKEKSEHPHQQGKHGRRGSLTFKLVDCSISTSSHHSMRGGDLRAYPIFI